MPRRHNQRHRTGDIGEAAFVLRATQLRLPLFRPLNAKGPADYLSDNGRTRPAVQIKTAGQRCSKNSYHTTIARGRHKNIPYQKHEIDFLVIYVLPEQAFYILPHKFLKGRVALNVPSTRRKNLGPYAQYLEAWHLLLGTKPPTRPRKPVTLTLQASAETPAADLDPLPAPNSGLSKGDQTLSSRPEHIIAKR